MKLAEWLAREGVKRKEFAEMIGVTPSYVTAICADTLWPGRETAQRIEVATKGEVTPSDFYQSGAA